MELPKNEKIRLIQGISGVFHTPYIVEGKTSSTGKTIRVEEKHGNRAYRLDAEKILTGGVEVRRATTFKLYTRENLIRQKKANYDPANYRNLDTKDVMKSMLEGDYPEPTHQVVGEISEG
ncbi:hypothetical protein K9M06_01105 [Candidatus Bipolaricaulota bacterium]|nr:hypothetical protein [Candidatus Bipolaricaulota bacterium]